jgi:hypothetical protein
LQVGSLTALVPFSSLGGKPTFAHKTVRKNRSLRKRIEKMRSDAWLLGALLACAACAQSTGEADVTETTPTEEDGSIEPEYSFHMHPEYKTTGQVIRVSTGVPNESIRLVEALRLLRAERCSVRPPSGRSTPPWAARTSFWEVLFAGPWVAVMGQCNPSRLLGASTRIHPWDLAASCPGAGSPAGRADFGIPRAPRGGCHLESEADRFRRMGAADRLQRKHPKAPPSLCLAQSVLVSTREYLVGTRAIPLRVSCGRSDSD